MAFTSLIIATYNWPEALNLCLLSIQKQTKLPLEIIIADDGSGPETEAIVKKFQAKIPVPIIHIWHKDAGFRKSLILNKSVKAASGDYIVQIDGDVILDKDFILDHISLAEKGFFVRGTRSHIAKHALDAIFKKEKVDFSFYSRGIIHRFNAIRIPLLSIFLQKKERKSNNVRGSNLAFWKADFILINGYNNDLKGWGHEDEELAIRFVNNNILKKAVKLKAIQHHLTHSLSPRTQKDFHIITLNNTQLKQLKTCKNGYHQTLENPE